MSGPQPERVIVVGAGAAGLMAARELARAGRRVTILEARDRCGGRIDSLSPSEFGYRAEGGAEFVHGEAPVTRAVLREAGLSLLPVQGARWTVDQRGFSQDDAPDPHSGRFRQALAELKTDVTVADFLKRHFAGPEYAPLRQSVLRTVESYDAADPARASMLAIREEWLNGGRSGQARVAGGYGALIDVLAEDCRKHGASIHLAAAVDAIETRQGQALVRCVNGDSHTGDAAVVTVPLPAMRAIALPPEMREMVAAAADIGIGNVIKILLRFKTRWWIGTEGRELSDLLFVISDRAIPVWWTQHPDDHPVFTGWIAGPRTEAMAGLDESELIEAGLASLADIFARPREQLMRDLVAARAINWGKDPFARGAYSYATLETRAAQSALAASPAPILFSGEALYRGPEMGTVEAALASGLATARAILAS
ncbi:MAG TPA: NAD(P)/FAD-dependent oxidoreductase [Bradyrhizobium sp.]|nr:NAD(P)/FAD-dependent oxidoreductase [Bradyrhizobium sp.]